MKDSDKDALIGGFKVLILPFLIIGVVGMVMEGYSKVEIILAIWNAFLGLGCFIGILYAIEWGGKKSVWQGWLLGLAICFVWGIFMVEF